MLESDVRLPQRIETYRDLIVNLQAVVNNGSPVAVNGVVFSLEKLGELLTIVQRPNERIVGLRVEKLRGLITGKDPFDRWLGARIGELNIVPKKRWEQAAGSLREKLPLTAKTPLEFVPKPAPGGEILTEKVLADTRDFIELSEKPDSVASQLADPVKLTLYGLRISLRPDANPGEEFIYDATVPTRLLEILKTLKYTESKDVFKNWLLTQFSKTTVDTEAALHFLEILINFTSFLDKNTLQELWKPPSDIPGRGQELLLQPFHSLLESVEYVHQQLFRVDPTQSVLQDLGQTQTLIKMRYGEVYRGLYAKSLYTVSPDALTPTPQDFADIAMSMYKETPNGNKKEELVGKAVVKLAESVGLDKIDHVIVKLNAYPGLQQAVLMQAKRSGLLYSSSTFVEVIESLEKNPWQDAAEIDFATIIKDETTDFDIYMVTGTFGPFTKGHKDLLEKLLGYIDSLPEKTRDGSRVFQRIVLILPVTDTSNLPNYPKSASRMGRVETRVSCMLIQIPEVDRKKVFISTQLQPDPSLAQNVEVRVLDTTHRLLGKISSDFQGARRAAGFNRTVKFAFGPDGLKWDDALTLAPKERQPRRALEPDGVIVVRREWLLPVLQNIQKIARETNIGTVILTPGTPHSSSTRVIEEIATKGETQAVEAAARDFVKNYWSPEFIQRRETLPIPNTILSVGQIYSRTLEMRRLAGSQSGPRKSW